MTSPRGATRTASTTLAMSPGEAEVSADLLRMGIEKYKEDNGGAASGLAKSVAAIGARTVIALGELAGDAPKLSGGPQ